MVHLCYVRITYQKIIENTPRAINDNPPKKPKKAETLLINIFSFLRNEVRPKMHLAENAQEGSECHNCQDSAKHDAHYA